MRLCYSFPTFLYPSITASQINIYFPNHELYGIERELSDLRTRRPINFTWKNIYSTELFFEWKLGENERRRRQDFRSTQLFSRVIGPVCVICRGINGCISIRISLYPHTRCTCLSLSLPFFLYPVSFERSSRGPMRVPTGQRYHPRFLLTNY